MSTRLEQGSAAGHSRECFKGARAAVHETLLPISKWTLTCLSNAMQEGCSVWQQVEGRFHCRPHKVCVHRRQRSIVCLTGCLRNDRMTPQTLGAADKHSDKYCITCRVASGHLLGAEALLEA